MTLSLDIVLASLDAGGAERVALNLLRGIDRDTIKARLVLLNRSGPLEELIPEGCDCINLGKARLRSAGPALYHTLRRQRADLVFSTIGYLNLAILAMKPMLSGKVVVREANLPSISLPMAPYPGIMKSGYRYLYPHSDHVIATSERMKTELTENFSVQENRISVMPNPVDTTAIRSSFSSQPASNDGTGIRFVAAGRLVPQKGFDRLISAFKACSTSHRLTIWGEGPERDTLQNLIENSPRSGQITLGGFTPSLASKLTDADVFLLPSRWEGMPNAVLEALTCGIPVIATAESGGIAELAKLAPPGEITVCDTWADFTNAMLATKQGRETHGHNLLPKRFELDSVAKQFSDLLQSVASAP